MAADEDRSYIMRYLPLYKAALKDDWEAALIFLSNDPTADLTAIISISNETALHIAVGAKTSHRFVTKLVQHIKTAYPDNYGTKLRMPDYVGNTALHFAAMVGNIDDASILFRADPDLIQIRNNAGVTAMKLAAWYGHKETLQYLSTFQWSEAIKEDRLTNLITTGFYDRALFLMDHCAHLAVSITMDDLTASLRTLAIQPEAFPSGRNWWFWKNLIYSGIPEDSDCFNSIIKYVPFLKSIHEIKVVEKQADLLTKAIIRQVQTSSNYKLVWDMLGKAMHEAAKYGIHELIEYRQVKVYNLHYQMTGRSAQAGYHTNNGNNLLHLSAKKASPDRLNTITGAALQMQRELQWFKEVEKFVNSSYKKAINKDGQTPQMLFTVEHKDLVEKGEKWMKDTATSSTLVAALIVTVAFAAIFTAPGGNADNGKPNFVLDSVFVVFAVADSLALFSYVTSVLMFTALLTSRYSEDDFLYALPKRMTIGLLSLFISIASLMVTFCAALVLVMRAKVSWIAIPAGVVAVVPVTCFALLQFPLLVELVLSTFGPNIFHKQKNVILH